MEHDANFLQVPMAPVLIQSLCDMVDVHLTIGRQYNFCCLNLQWRWYVGIPPCHGYLLVAEWVVQKTARNSCFTDYSKAIVAVKRKNEKE